MSVEIMKTIAALWNIWIFGNNRWIYLCEIGYRKKLQLWSTNRCQVVSLIVVLTHHHFFYLLMFLKVFKEP